MAASSLCFGVAAARTCHKNLSPISICQNNAAAPNRRSRNGVKRRRRTAHAVTFGWRGRPGTWAAAAYLVEMSCRGTYAPGLAKAAAPCSGYRMKRQRRRA